MIRSLIRPLYVMAAALVVGVACLAGIVIYHQTRYDGRAFPGVRLQGTDLSGLSPEEIFDVAQLQGRYFTTPSIILRATGQTFTYRPADFGVGLDPAETTRAAMNIGREGNLPTQLRKRVEAWWRGVDVSPVVRLDDAEAAHVIGQVAKATERAPQDAKINMDGGAVQETKSQTGIELDRDATLRLVNSAILSNQPANIDLPYKTLEPHISTTSNAATALTQLFNGDLVVQMPQWDEQGNSKAPTEAIRIRQADLKDFAIIEDVPPENGVAKVNIRVKREKLRGLIEPLAASVNQSPLNARFLFDELGKRIINQAPSRDGRTLNIDNTLNAIETALRTGSGRTVTLAVDMAPAAVQATASAADLGITQLITQATTYFRGSSAARLANVKVAAARFNGVVVPAGGTFSFNEYLGDVSEKDGFEVGLIIVGNRTVKGVGGGVCQVSTTAYQAALRAGFPILERYPHGYRVHYYENGMGAGFDASVFSPYADFKFVNDTKSALLVQTVFDPVRVTLTFRFFGTPDDRQVTISDSTIGDIKPHGPDIYEKDTDNEVSAGKAKQVDYAVDGATIWFTRQVTRGGQTLIDEKVTSKYVAWQSVFRFADGFTPPPGAEVHGPDGAIITPAALTTPSQ